MRGRQGNRLTGGSCAMRRGRPRFGFAAAGSGGVWSRPMRVSLMRRTPASVHHKPQRRRWPASQRNGRSASGGTAERFDSPAAVAASRRPLAGLTAAGRLPSLPGRLVECAARRSRSCRRAALDGPAPLCLCPGVEGAEPLASSLCTQRVSWLMACKGHEPARCAPILRPPSRRRRLAARRRSPGSDGGTRCSRSRLHPRRLWMVHTWIVGRGIRVRCGSEKRMYVA